MNIRAVGFLDSSGLLPSNNRQSRRDTNGERAARHTATARIGSSGSHQHSVCHGPWETAGFRCDTLEASSPSWVAMATMT